MTKTKEELYEELEEKKQYLNHLLIRFRNGEDMLDLWERTVKERKLELIKQQEEIQQLQKSIYKQQPEEN